MSVHYKFKSSLDYDTITYDGLHISVGDLKKAILAQKKIGKGFDFDLQITNAQTKEIYSDDDAQIPKNASVIVSRVPNSLSAKKAWERNDNSTLLPVVATEGSDSVSFDKVTKNADLVSSNVSEDEKIRTMMTQSTHDYDPSRYVKTKGMSGPIPPNYTCFRCGRAGHWIKNCPTNSLEVKRSTGIPRSFMVTVEGPEVPGALLTSSGQFAVPMIDHEAYKEGKKERPPFARETSPERDPAPQIPEELLCMICRDLLSDAVLIPCCGNSYCDECVRQALLDSDEHECPTCHEKDISPDTLIPNRFLRTAVMNFKNETGYTKAKKPLTIIPPLMATEIPPPAALEKLSTEAAGHVEVAAPSIEASHADHGVLIAVTNSGGEHPGTPVRDEQLDNDNETVADAAENFDGDKIADGDEIKDTPSSPVYHSISTITTRMNSPLVPVMPQKPWMKPAPRVAKPPPLLSQETMLRLPPRTLSSSAASSTHRLVSQQQAASHLESSLSYVTPSSTLPMLSSTTGTTPNYSTPPPSLKPPPPRVLMPSLSSLPPPSHLMGIPPHFSRHPPPPIPSMFHGPPPSHHPGLRRPVLPPPGPNPLGGGSSAQPLPPGVRPLLPPLLPAAGDSYHHPPLGGYPSRQDDYYRDHRSYVDRERASRDPMDAFARELFEYRPRGHHSRRRSASSSRSCSSRSGYHSRSPSTRTRSRSRSARSSRSRSLSYSSRSRSSSPNYSRSHSPYSQRSRSRSRSRTRSRSRSKTAKYSSPSHRKSRSHSPRGRRSPHVSQPPPPPRRRRDYSPSGYYHGLYRGPPPPPVPPQPLGVPPFEIPARGRYVDPYRTYESYRYEEDPRYAARDPRFDYAAAQHYEEYYHRGAGGMHPPVRGHRAWMSQGKPEDHRPLPRPPRETIMPRRGGPPVMPLMATAASGPHRARSPLVISSEKELVGSRDWNPRRYGPDKGRGYRDADAERGGGKDTREYSDANTEPIGTRKPRKTLEPVAEEKSRSEKKSSGNGSSAGQKSNSEDKAARPSASSDKDKSKEKHHKRKAHHHHGGAGAATAKGESPAKKARTSGVGKESEVTSSDSPGATSKKSSRKKRKKTRDSGGDAEASEPGPKTASLPRKEAKKEGRGSNGESAGAKPAKGAAKPEKGAGRADRAAAEKPSREERAKAGGEVAEPAKPQREPLVDYRENEGTEAPSEEDENANTEQDAESQSREDPEAPGPKQEPQEPVVPPFDEAGPREDEELMLSVGAEELVDEEAAAHEMRRRTHAEEEVDENVLTAPVPEPSKWELDDAADGSRGAERDEPSERGYGARQQQRPGARHGLPPDIVQRAEKAILQKALKAIVPTPEAPKAGRKPGGGASDVEERPGSQAREEDAAAAGPKVVANSNGKRSGEKAGGSKPSKDGGRDRIRLDRSKFVERSGRGEPAVSSTPPPGRSGQQQHSSQKPDAERDREEKRGERRDRSAKDSGASSKGRSSHDQKGRERSQRHDSDERSSGRHGGSRHEEARRGTRSPERTSRSLEHHSARERSRDAAGEARSRDSGSFRREAAVSDKDKHQAERHHSGGSRSAGASQRAAEQDGGGRRGATDAGGGGKANPPSPERRSGKSPERKSGRKREVEAESASRKSEKHEEVKANQLPQHRDRRLSTIDESKFEPDYDDDRTVAATAENSGNEPPSKKRRSSSSASSSSSSPSATSSRGSSSPARAAKKARKSSPAAAEAKASKHKKSKHKKHKKHKHKHKKSKKSKQKDSEEKDGGKSGVKSIVKH